MRTKDTESRAVPHGSMTIAVIVLLFCFAYQSLGLSQGPPVKESGVQTKARREENSKVTDERRDLEVEKQEARKTVDEITKELANSTRPNPYLYLDRGHAYMLLGEFEKAFEDYTKAIESPERRLAAYIALRYRVMAAVGKGDYAQALKDAREVTKASPPQADAFAVVALILARSPDDNVRDAKEALDCAITASTMEAPRRDVVLVERALAAAYSANGDFKEAVAHQEKALAALKGKIPSDMKAQLEAYKAGKEYPFPLKKVPQ